MHQLMGTSQKIPPRMVLYLKLVKFANTDDDKCWRECGLTGSLLYILWKCPHIRSFWNSLISEMTRCLTPPTPALGVLSLGIKTFPHNHRALVIHILIGSKIDDIMEMAMQLTA